MSEVTLTENEYTELRRLFHGRMRDEVQSWTERIITARLAEVIAERDEWRSATGDPTPNHHRATTAELRASLEELARQRDASLAETAQLRLDRAEFADRNESLRSRIDRSEEIGATRLAEAVAAVTPCSCSAQRARAEQAEAENARLRDTLASVRDEHEKTRATLGRVKALTDWPVGRATNGVDRMIPASEVQAAITGDQA